MKEKTLKDMYKTKKKYLEAKLDSAKRTRDAYNRSYIDSSHKDEYDKIMYYLYQGEVIALEKALRDFENWKKSIL